MCASVLVQDGWSMYDVIIIAFSLMSLATDDVPGVKVLRLMRAFRRFCHLPTHQPISVLCFSPVCLLSVLRSACLHLCLSSSHLSVSCPSVSSFLSLFLSPCSSSPEVQMPCVREHKYVLVLVARMDMIHACTILTTAHMYTYIHTYICRCTASLRAPVITAANHQRLDILSFTRKKPAYTTTTCRSM